MMRAPKIRRLESERKEEEEVKEYDIECSRQKASRSGPVEFHFVFGQRKKLRRSM